ncbi:Schizosaccharomyces pombe specific protein [Schizosaccharomyces pombe]|uniref:Uncharacterized protein C16E8.18 n=1 Tax=Schizosaccharomyces pombe (strain 972 / ATCC 24843) TaxID=284812 RepID=YDRI_SCHPO|nr:uncharacterized protein SPAC16E8.18 [Schizosaccharomyces pombe]O13746.3 RecName: Full=Uncharacterized protein C16E8.18 [Schizosaccharomyces pombe 972h-]CAB11040.2 sequence orphan [Schizosaccharomyces pombe]|eukprot:NP_594224.1 uncharacterized protein SPAC16E8.18 [Schizosaccharomyces pombe]
MEVTSFILNATFKEFACFGNNYLIILPGIMLERNVFRHLNYSTNSICSHYQFFGGHYESFELLVVIVYYFSHVGSFSLAEIYRITWDKRIVLYGTTTTLVYCSEGSD